VPSEVVQDEQEWGAGLTSQADVMTPAAVISAATLGLADHIAGGARTVATLAGVIGRDPTLRRLVPLGLPVAVDEVLLGAVLGRLVFAGLIGEDDGRYELTDTGVMLCGNHPSQLRARLDVRGEAGTAALTVVDLLTALLTVDRAPHLTALLRSAPPTGLAQADLTTPVCIRVAATLRLADCIAAGARTVAALARVIVQDPHLRPALPPDAQVAVDEVLLAALLGRLVFAGVIGEVAGRYELTATGSLLLSDHPHHVRDWLDVLWPIGRGDLSLVHLTESVLTSRPTFDLRHGRNFWDDLAADSQRTEHFTRLMGMAQRAAEAPDVVPKYDWGGLGSVLDLGGGDASLLRVLLEAYPQLRGAVLELPGPTALAAGIALRTASLAGRSEVITGDFFEPLPPGYGGYILSAILHDWPDEKAVAILRRCATAAGPDGKVFVIEGWGHSQGADMQTTMALRLAALFGGRERTSERLAALAGAANLTVISTIRTTHRTILVMRPTTGSF
jgi:hypothetical protein